MPSGVDPTKQHSVVYVCAVCKSASSVIVTGLSVPAGPYHDDLVESSAMRALEYATCARCGARNPEGVAALAKSAKTDRIVGTLVSTAAVIAVWFLPWFAYVVVGFVTIVAAITIVIGAQAKSLRWPGVVSNLVFVLLLLAAARFYPRAASLMPLILAVRFAIGGGDKSEWRWTNAKAQIRFDTPYR